MIHSSEINSADDFLKVTTGGPPKRGKHKIFIGMAPGVGKTYRMLEEGHNLKHQGIDVVIGVVETHGREETAQKVTGLELIPRKTLVCKGLNLTELNTEAIITRSPQLVLIDELAHTNVPGSKNEKRYQDVEEVLVAGIDVYSTLNIQHLESLNDLVLKISGVVVRERIPDRILDKADEVVVIDVTPESLQQRLREGKIYAPEKIDQALQNFFQKGNLIALRELALREMANNVEEDRAEILYRNDNNICNICERVLVCVSTYPKSIQLLRRGARLANYMSADFYVLFVDNPNHFLTKVESLHLETCEQLCDDFGGEFLRLKSNDAFGTIVDVAKTQRITQIVVGETGKSRWELLFRGSLVQRLRRSLPDIDIHIIGYTSL
jgi:two-component system sensor histidine kinase KdpD